MKNLFVVRHAKSSWANPGQPDIERPLNERGKTDAPVMGKRLADFTKVDLLISSPAKRALKTCKIFADELGYDKENILVIYDLYQASVPTFYQVVETMPASANTIVLFSHNPGITDFVNDLTDKLEIGDMPTCAVFGVSADIEDWKDFAKADKEKIFLAYPKDGSE